MNAIIKILKKIKRKLKNIPEKKPIKDILENYSKIKSHVTFVQVGSNDGTTSDPINKYIISDKWNGLLIEPVPNIFNKLKENYAGFQEGLIFENVAISKQDGEASFYRLMESNNPDLPIWYNQIGSFNKDVVLKHRDSVPGFDELFIEEKVKTMTFESLVQKHKLEKIDLIHIDAEGYDFEILKTIDFNRFNLDIVLFEHKHLQEEDYKSALKLLRDHNFKFYRFNNDTIAINKKYKHL